MYERDDESEATRAQTDALNAVQRPAYRWTVMVYFASDDVDQYDVENLSKLKRAGSTDEVALLAQVDPTTNKESTRYWLQKKTKLEEDVVDRFSNLDAGSPDALINFVRWGARSAPADHYMVVLWGHGDGWQNEDNAGRAAGRTVNTKLDKEKLRERLNLSKAQDPKIETLLEGLALPRDQTVGGLRSPDVLDGPALKSAFVSLKESLGRKIDILGMDSCLMAMVEVAYQLRNCVDYMVACEDVTPIASWPYDSIFAELVSHPEMSPVQLGQTVVRQYLIDYLDQTRFVTQSVCHVDRSADLASAVDTLAVELIKGMNDDKSRLATMTARAMVQSYYIKDYVDLYNFCDILADLLGDPKHELTCACEAVKKVVGKVVGTAVTHLDTFISVHGYYGFPLKDSHGASIYFPLRHFSNLYNQLDFPHSTAWGRFIEGYAGLIGPGKPIPQKETGGTIIGGHLGGAGGDGQLGPGDPILIPPDPLGTHRTKPRGRCGAPPNIP
jgi:hypothetical protein